MISDKKKKTREVINAVRELGYLFSIERVALLTYVSDVVKASREKDGTSSDPNEINILAALEKTSQAPTVMNERERTILTSPDRARIHAAIDAIRFLEYLTQQERTALLTYTTVVIQSSQVLDANRDKAEEAERNTRLRKANEIADGGDDEELAMLLDDAQERQQFESQAERIAKRTIEKRNKELEKQANRKAQGYKKPLPPTQLGHRHYTDGTRMISLGPNQPIPHGFRLGSTNLGRKSYTDGRRTIKLGPNDRIPPGFAPGRHFQCRPPSQLGRKHYTDGQQTITLGPNEPIPQGFRPGQTKRMRM